MIRVVRPSAIPAVLQSKGKAATLALCAAHDSNPTAYAGGQMLFAFDSDIYGADQVKSALRLAQHEKCCFCESKVSHISYGDVEHYRPKAAFRQKRVGKLQRPGYYWLAYEWTNLFFCCQLCNQRFKENLFPLANPRQRAKSHHDVITKETPLFINPEEDPSAHLGFRKEYLFAVKNSRRGRTTIEALGLNRPELVERRRDNLAIVLRLAESTKLLEQQIQQDTAKGLPVPQKFVQQVTKNSAELARRTTDAAEYSAMAHAALA